MRRGWGQALSAPTPQVLGLQASYGQQQVADLSGMSVVEALKAGSNWIIYEPVTSHAGQQVGEAQIRKELQMLYDRGFRGLVTYAFDNGREEIPRPWGAAGPAPIPLRGPDNRAQPRGRRDEACLGIASRKARALRPAPLRAHRNSANLSRSHRPAQAASA